jgi:Tol biopolymer transport system component
VSDTNLPQPEDHSSLSWAAAGAGSGQPRRRKRRWLGNLLALSGLTGVALAIILVRLGAGPLDGRPGATSLPPTSTSKTSRPVGGLLYIREGSQPGNYDVWVANPDGTNGRNLTPDPASETEPDWSPDGRRVVYAAMPSRCQGSACQSDLYTIDREGSRRVRLTRTLQDETAPDWSPDGTRIAYTRRDGDRLTVWVMRADGSGQRPLSADPGTDPDWAPDGKRLLYLHDGSGGQSLYTINADGSARRRLGSLNLVRTARWSPDGTRIALTAHDAVWILNADGGGLRRIRQSGAYPSWSPNGRQLVFIAYASAATGTPELRRIDIEGRNEVVLRRDQADSAPKLR